MSRRLVPAARRVATTVAVLLALWGFWELYRWTWIETGWTWPFPVNDTTLPHVHVIVKALFEPSRTDGPLLITVLFHSAVFTAKEAITGFAIGAVFGFVLAVGLVHSRLAQRALTRIPQSKSTGGASTPGRFQPLASLVFCSTMVVPRQSRSRQNGMPANDSRSSL